jgi:hypothetical protein
VHDKDGRDLEVEEGAWNAVCCVRYMHALSRVVFGSLIEITLEMCGAVLMRVHLWVLTVERKSRKVDHQND